MNNKLSICSRKTYICIYMMTIIDFICMLHLPNDFPTDYKKPVSSISKLRDHYCESLHSLSRTTQSVAFTPTETFVLCKRRRNHRSYRFSALVRRDGLRRPDKRPSHVALLVACHPTFLQRRCCRRPQFGS